MVKLCKVVSICRSEEPRITIGPVPATHLSKSINKVLIIIIVVLISRRNCLLWTKERVLMSHIWLRYQEAAMLTSLTKTTNELQVIISSCKAQNKLANNSNNVSSNSSNNSSNFTF